MCGGGLVRGRCAAARGNCGHAPEGAAHGADLPPRRGPAGRPRGHCPPAAISTGCRAVVCQSRRSHERIAARSTSKTTAVACPPPLPPRPAFRRRALFFFFFFLPLSLPFVFFPFSSRSRGRFAFPYSEELRSLLYLFRNRYCLTAAPGVPFHVSTGDAGTCAAVRPLQALPPSLRTSLG